MEFFKHNTNINFMGIRRWTCLLSVVAVLASIGFLFMNGLNWGLEFTGGTEIHVSFKQNANIPEIRTVMQDAGFKDVVVQAYGPPTHAMIRLSGDETSEQKEMGTKVNEILPQATVLSANYIGPQVGKELATNGALALFVALLGAAVYIALRFEYRLALSAALALAHDPVIVLGVFSAWQLDFDLITLAALLMIIGYSLNDTIVVFDRVRENFRRQRNTDTAEVMNLSVNQTLSRTIITSGSTLLVVVALLLFGGEVLHGFSVALLLGIVIGTYSSIYVAGALAVTFGLKRDDLLPPSAEVLDERP